MNVIDFCQKIIFSPKLEDKLISPEVVKCFNNSIKASELPNYPARDHYYNFSEDRFKFPKPGSLRDDKKRGVALHFFANHELLAIEMMAGAILKFSSTVDEKVFKKISIGILSSLKDEQKHFTLYKKRMLELGVSFGEVPLNDFFWRQFKHLHSFEDFFSIMSLTFEAANLDFAYFYGKLFREMGDEKTSKIMDIVYNDELKHVQLGAHWIRNLGRYEKLWEGYLVSLPEGITPARSKGIHYMKEHRVKAGLPSDFVDKIDNYRDDFKVTNRRR